MFFWNKIYNVILIKKTYHCIFDKFLKNSFQSYNYQNYLLVRRRTSVDSRQCSRWKWIPKKIILYLRKNTWKQLTFYTRIILFICFSAIDTRMRGLTPCSSSSPSVYTEYLTCNFHRIIRWRILCGDRHYGINMLRQGLGLNKIDSFFIAAIIFH